MAIADPEPSAGSIESLPPARRAVLMLLVEGSRSYADLATLLHSDAAAVRARALDAAEELMSDSPAAPARELRGALVDYALGQQGVAERQRTRAALAESPIARGWVARLERAIGLEAVAEPPARVAPPPVPVAAPRPGPAEHARRWSQRARVYLAVGVAAIVIGVVLLLIGGAR